MYRIWASGEYKVNGALASPWLYRMSMGTPDDVDNSGAGTAGVTVDPLARGLFSHEYGHQLGLWDTYLIWPHPDSLMSNASPSFLVIPRAS